ncbi:unnamed protein product [Kuraishia capsulata CBS 1993]|uniref:Major facilitator superfamily (MFS) profile domain-containing protein n=1 Tax=Kuraishia capsulata CBS 1993 TaxID=1382522 RepID=W6MQX1_9ASCO|nr:uncharacterized protein KUCA_T00004738001 [Kuraishia capsulata CBS 1993]CDK28753.1 unnamed protein product [Kuraishia capsulata CBS 1993]
MATTEAMKNESPAEDTTVQQTEEHQLASVKSFDFDQLEAAAHAQQKIEHELTRWQAIKAYPKASAWILFMVWLMILVGYEGQAGSIVVSIPQFRQDFGHWYEDQYVLETKWQSAISGAPLAAIAFSSMTSSWFADRFGRKWIIVAGLVVSVPSIAIEFVATTINVFMAGKMVNALCLGIFSTMAISYVSEVSPLALRGLAAGACSLSLCIGPFICYLINNKTATYTSRMAYRGVFIPQWVFSVSCLFFAPFMPESPYYFIRKDRNEDALKSLKRLYTPTQAYQQFAIMKVTYEELKLITQSSTYLDCFKKKDIKRTFTILFAFFMQPMSGVTFISSYSTYYFQYAGWSTQRSYQLSCGGQALSITGVITSWFIIDRFGRRPLMLYGITALTVLNLIVACAGLSENNYGAMVAASAFMVMYNFFYNLGIGPLPYIMATEVSSVSLRAKTMALATLTNYAFQCMWSFVLPYMFNADQADMGSKINFIFTGMSFLSIFVFYFIQPETAGRSFEEIDELYDKNIPLKEWKLYKTQKQQDSDRFYDDLKQEVSHVEYNSEPEVA